MQMEVKWQCRQAGHLHNRGTVQDPPQQRGGRKPEAAVTLELFLGSHAHLASSSFLPHGPHPSFPYTSYPPEPPACSWGASDPWPPAACSEAPQPPGSYPSTCAVLCVLPVLTLHLLPVLHFFLDGRWGASRDRLAISKDQRAVRSVPGLPLLLAAERLLTGCHLSVDVVLGDVAVTQGRSYWACAVDPASYLVKVGVGLESKLQESFQGAADVISPRSGPLWKAQFGRGPLQAGQRQCGVEGEGRLSWRVSGAPRWGWGRGAETSHL